MEMNKKKYIEKVNEILNADIINDMSFRISKIKEEEIYDDMYMDNNKIIWVDNIYKVLRCFIACFDNLFRK